MEQVKNKSVKCESCEQKFNEDQLTKQFNNIYNQICSKCREYIENRGDLTGNCSNYCINSGKCDNSCK